ncbi:butyrophilin subfamily 2 member A2 isoform X2 [Etheostoma spectabile]|uniref:butyrophilin subfamily 2 member A2 isoform X2 n=1 Tax=Etheostoma spectabile TaxID=54343 RepID=UPI0013AF7EF7|nr:butyrophilin subfamily 2 member A2-like isoform X2 [Etheostoma spectabile]
MGALMTYACLVAALGASLCVAAPVSGGLQVSVPSPVSVQRGHTTTLPCWLNPPQSAEALEVRWYRLDHFDSPILFYRDKRFQESSQTASYSGRVSFGLKDAVSGGLTAGDLTLRLENATIEDAGDYTCYVSSDQGYDGGSVRLVVTEMGTSPLLSAEWEDDHTVNVSCESEGWYPEPSLRWSDQNQVLTPKNLKYSKDSSGLLSVHSWLLVPSSTEVSCTVGVSDKEPKKARVRLENRPPAPESGSSAAGWGAFALLLVAVVVSLAVLYYKRREKKHKSRNEHTEETDALLPKEVIRPTVNLDVDRYLSTAKEFNVNVTLDQKPTNQYITIRGCKLRDAPPDQCVFPDGDKVTCLTAVKGAPGFSSGQHYWEVSLGKDDANVGLKMSWWVGVTSAAVPQESGYSPNTSNGFWFLSSSPDSPETFQFSSEAEVLLPVRSRPQTLGVYLNYDDGELSFYNVNDESLIGTLNATFTGEVFPFFNPGKGDRGVMEILQMQKGQSSVGNMEDVRQQET